VPSRYGHMLLGHPSGLAWRFEFIPNLHCISLTYPKYILRLISPDMSVSRLPYRQACGGARQKRLLAAHFRMP
jgi:hypothetical protein